MMMISVRYENKRPCTRFPIVVDGTSEEWDDTSSPLLLKTDKGVYYGVVGSVVSGAIFSGK